MKRKMNTGAAPTHTYTTQHTHTCTPSRQGWVEVINIFGKQKGKASWNQRKVKQCIKKEQKLNEWG